MRDFQGHEVVHRGDHLDIKPGQSFAFVSGLGGYDIRDQELYNDWWGSIYTSTQGAEHGALFCTLNGADADCYFKDINGTVPDRFTLHNEHPLSSTTGNNEEQPRPDNQSAPQSPVDGLDDVPSSPEPTSDTGSDSTSSPETLNSSSNTRAGALSTHTWLVLCLMYIICRRKASPAGY